MSLKKMEAFSLHSYFQSLPVDETWVIFLYNVEQLQKKKGLPLIVARRPVGGKHTLSDYLPCKFCLRFYLKGELWRHCKTCPFIEEPLSNFYKDMDDIKGVKQFRKAGQLLLEGALGPKSISEKEKRDF